MSIFLNRLGKKKLFLVRAIYNDFASWQQSTAFAFDIFKSSFTNKEEFMKNAEQDLYAFVLEHFSASYDIKSPIKWVGTGAISKDIDFYASCKDGSFLTVKAITCVKDDAVIKRNPYYLSSFTTQSVLNYGRGDKKLGKMLIIANADFHESLKKEWLPYTTGKVDS